MREIKFRTLVNGEWLYFDLTQNPKYWAHKLKGGIIDQYTGLKDVNGVEIYESDVVEDYNRNLFTVEYNMFCSFMLYPLKNREKFLAIYPTIELKVIGNIHENPELLLEEETHDR